ATRPQPPETLHEPGRQGVSRRRGRTGVRPRAGVKGGEMSRGLPMPDDSTRDVLGAWNPLGPADPGAAHGPAAPRPGGPAQAGAARATPGGAFDDWEPPIRDFQIAPGPAATGAGDSLMGGSLLETPAGPRPTVGRPDAPGPTPAAPRAAPEKGEVIGGFRIVG